MHSDSDTNNGKVSQSVVGSVDRNTSRNPLSAGDNGGAPNSAPVSRVHLQLDVPSYNVHDTFDKENIDDDGIARLANALPQVMSNENLQ